MFMEKLKELERSVDLKKIDKEKLKNEEMKRINREFLLNDYERRYNVKQQIVLNALVGVENAHVEFNKQIKEQREFHQKLAICKTFNFLDQDENKIIKPKKLSSNFFRNLSNKSDKILAFDYEDDLNKEGNSS